VRECGKDREKEKEEEETIDGIGIFHGGLLLRLRETVAKVCFWWQNERVRRWEEEKREGKVKWRVLWGMVVVESSLFVL
jgi:hypothetical protein